MSQHYSGPNFGFPRGDARLDFTDLYAFPKPDDAGKSILIMNEHPSATVNPPGATTAEPWKYYWEPTTSRAIWLNDTDTSTGHCQMLSLMNLSTR
jgi:hypothetical protein